MERFPIPTVEKDKLREVVKGFGKVAPSVISGLWGSSAALITAEAARLAAEAAPTIIVITPDERDAAFFRDDVEFFLGCSVPLYPAFDPRTASEAESRFVFSERLSILTRISPAARTALSAGKPKSAAGKPRVVVMPVSALLDPVPAPVRDPGRFFLRFFSGMSLAPEEIGNRLDRAGFQASPMVTVPGEFSIRGDIIDIYPMATARPVRLEFLDNEVESIREIDPENQRSVTLLDRYDLFLAGLGDETKSSPTHHIPKEIPVLVREPDEVNARLRAYSRELKIPDELKTAAARFIEERPAAGLVGLSNSKDKINYRVLSAQGVGLKSKITGRTMPDLNASIKNFLERCRRVRILCQVEAEAERFRAVLKEQGISPGRRVRVEVGRVAEGFQFPELGLCVVNHHELMRRLPVRRAKRKGRGRARALESFRELNNGDYVVHLVHGIARYEGLTRMERESGGEEDFLVLVSKNDVLLYVPASKIHLVHRYVGGGEGAPSLDLLGGSAWTKRRMKVQGMLRDLAADLLETQAVRSEERGFAFHLDDDLQVLFDASFPYEDTEDQITAMSALKSDQESRKPMDRLLCGDVGFGKTELAIRAAFKSVLSGKQTAVLVPTTILAEQHFETFRTRLADYPVTVEVLSRFRSRKEQNDVASAVREGRVDILIGTHRILSSDVGFKDLGLLVIDEEQRFGVRHKERLKSMKRTVDVLTMTATPIPRTLHMALVGIRDISSLETPPEGRMPIHTQVNVKGDSLLRRALLLEVSRGGQVFFLHNRVESIAAETQKLSALVPSVRIAFAHGRMRERELQGVIRRFVRREIDVLVCTTIIESGIDMPQVNTIIIDRADTFGLADLHQLRGRVGRGSVRAYCYLLIPYKRIPGIALRRLKAIEELSHLGAGYDIALKDLEIRGAGNILGAEQHGHIAAVGYDLYCRLLKKTVLKMKEEATGSERAGKTRGAEPEDVDLDIHVKAFLPAEFIPYEGIRMEILRRLSLCKSAGEFDGMEEELKDRFGRIPAEASRLIDLFRVRRLMAANGIRRLTRAGRSRELVVDLFDTRRFDKRKPFGGRKVNRVSPSRVVLVLPKNALAGNDLLLYLKSRLMVREALL